jgi:cytochrome c oxidase subunit II
MSLESPKEDWFEPPHGAEKIWIGIALAWCLVMFLMMPYWHLFGQQNTSGETFRVSPRDFEERVDEFVEANQVGELNGVPVVEPPPGGDAFLLGRMWEWYPVLKLRAGETYRIHLSALDLQHGFSLQPLNMNFRAIPGYDYVLTMTPQEPGEYTIVCNEFCGVGHHLMVGKLIVE